MFHLLIDTCIWLDLGKDYTQKPLLEALEELLKSKQISLILPRTVIEEFDRNKLRVIKESSKSLSSTIKRVKEVVAKFGDEKQKKMVLEHLSDVDHKLPSLGENAIEALGRVEGMFAQATIIEHTDQVKLRAAQRAIDRRAPFHHEGKNSIHDALLFETYTDFVSEHTKSGNRFVFITHNFKDFSLEAGDNRLPHNDLAADFSKLKSLYFISLADALRRIKPALLSELMFVQEWSEEPRRLTEIVESIDELATKVWYDRHQGGKQRIKNGTTKIVEKETFPIKDHATRPIQRDIWEGAVKAATEVEKRFGIDNLGPWDDFEWGMLNGKLSALRWVLGDEWDMLDT